MPPVRSPTSITARSKGVTRLEISARAALSGRPSRTASRTAARRERAWSSSGACRMASSAGTSATPEPSSAASSR